MKKILLIVFVLSARWAFAQGDSLPVSIAFPHIAIGGETAGQNFATLVQIVNNNSSLTTAHVQLFADDGSALQALFDGQGPQSTMDVPLDAGVARQIQLTSSGPITGGWMQITFSPSDALTTVILQCRSGTSLLSEVGVDPAANTIGTTDFAAETDAALNTGIAIANPSSTIAYILARLWSPDTGTVLSEGSVITLAPNGHIARYLTELFPTLLTINQIRAEVSLDACSSPSCFTAGGNGFIATALRQNIDQFTTIPVIARPGVNDPPPAAVRVL